MQEALTHAVQEEVNSLWVPLGLHVYIVALYAKKRACCNAHACLIIGNVVTIQEEGLVCL